MRKSRGARVRPALSALITTLNEAGALPLLLADLRGQRGVRIEILIADGGSSDATPAIARRYRARIIAAPRGRAGQLNAAAAAARAPWLLCLHADSRLTAPDQLARALSLLRAAHRRGRVVAGHWPLRFERSQPGHAALFRQLEAKSASNRPGTVNGDQGLLIHADALRALGGFDASLPFFEDQRLAGQVFARGRFVLLPGVLQTSARRFETEGHRNRLALMALIVGAEHAGLDDWLRALPGLYRAQHETAQLALAPFLCDLAAHLAALPADARRRVQQRTGNLLMSNAWQLALLLDQSADAPWLARFDSLLAPLLTRPPWPSLAGRAMVSAIHFAARWSKRS